MELRLRRMPNVAIAYFYFDFRDNDKRKISGMLQSCLAQLAAKSTTFPVTVEALYKKCNLGSQQPTQGDLRSALSSVVGGFDRVFLVLDALDECSEWNQFTGLFNMSNEWRDNLHLLMLSRREFDIERALEPYHPVKIHIDQSQLDADVRLHVKSRLKNDIQFSVVPKDLKDHIEDTLVEQAGGM